MGRPREVSDEEILRVARQIFLERGAGVSALEIGKALGISHTTVFNRFGSKEGLMVAALSPAMEIPWLKTLDAGPDERPVLTQLVELCGVMSSYFEHVQSGLSLLAAAGIAVDHQALKLDGQSRPALALQALSRWLRRAQGAGRIAECDVDVLAVTILGAMQNWSLTTRVCGLVKPAGGSEKYIAQFVQLLWSGIQR